MRPIVAALLAGVLLAACTDSGASTSIDDSEAFAEGVVLNHDRTPVVGASVVGLYRDGGAVGASWYRAAIPSSQTNTDERGRFQLTFRPGDIDRLIGAQISIPIAAASHPSAQPTMFQVRAPLSFDSSLNLIAIPGPLLPCDGRETKCGRALLPDLTPTISAEQLDPHARSSLEAERALLDDIDDQGVFPTETWFITTEDGRRLLRFASLTGNIGEGPLVIVADLDIDGTTVPTHQRVWTDTWHFQDREAGEFVFHDGHDHTHFDAFERYRLLDGQGDVVAESAKVSFCLRDSIRVLDLAQPVAGLFTDSNSCGAIQQSINPGYGDHYDQFLPDQWIDVTGVASGDYLVEITVDPLNTIIESDETNNQASFPVTILDP